MKLKVERGGGERFALEFSYDLAKKGRNAL